MGEKDDERADRVSRLGHFCDACDRTGCVGSNVGRLCAGVWKAADANKDGSLTEQELEKFKTIMAKVDTNKDGKISESEFMAACQKGDLKDVNK